MNFFKNSFQNVALSMYSVIVVFFWVPMLFATANRPLNIQASFKKLLLSLLISVLVFLFSPNKSIDLLMFSFFPLAALAASFIEYNNSKIQKEIVLFGCLIMGLTAYFLQL
jgi:hypothetical protein